MNKKFQVRISSVAYKLLAEFLSRDENLLIAALINDKVEIQQVELSSELLDASNGELRSFVPVVLVGYDGLNAVKTTSKCNVTVPGKSLVSVAGLAAEVTNDRSIIGDKLLDEWTKHLVRPQVLLSRKRRKVSTKSADNNNSSSQTSASIETPITISEQALAMAAENPTILFTTIVNTYDSLICMDISQECRQVAAGFRDSSVCIWHLDEENESGWPGSLLEPQRDHTLTTLPKYNRPPHGAASSSRNINHSSHGSKFAATSDRKDKLFLKLQGHSKPIYGICQDKTSRFVLSASGDETVRFWDTAVCQCVGKYTGISPFWGVSYSPLGYYFATANQDRCSYVYSTDRAQPLRIFSGHSSDVSCVTWHDNATLVATGSDDKTCRLWDLRTGNAVRVLQGVSSSITSVACSHDGRLLAAGSEGGTAHVWDLLSGKPLALLLGHEGPVYSTVFSEDTQTLATGGSDCCVRVWSLNSLTHAEMSPTQGSGSGSGSGGISAAIDRKVMTSNLTSAQFLLSPMYSFPTKYTPIFFLNYNSRNMIYAGGPYSTDSNMV